MNRRRLPDESFQFYREDQCTEEERIKDHMKGTPIWKAHMGPYRKTYGAIGTQSENKRRK